MRYIYLFNNINEYESQKLSISSLPFCAASKLTGVSKFASREFSGPYCTYTNRVIVYLAGSKLVETTTDLMSGLHTNAFNSTISSHTFSNGVGVIKFLNELDTINSNAFYNCSGLTSITIPYSVTSIGNKAFYNCYNLTHINIPNSATSIGMNAFCNCYNLTHINIPNSVTRIGVSVFAGCSGLTSITIPNSVTRIDMGAFYGCSGLTSITIPNSVTSIGTYAFGDCENLKTVIVKSSNPPSLVSDAFDNTNIQLVIVPDYRMPFYSTSTNWEEFEDKFVGVNMDDPEIRIDDYNRKIYLKTLFVDRYDLHKLDGYHGYSVYIDGVFINTIEGGEYYY